MDKTWSCLQCGCNYIEKEGDRISSDLNTYLHYAGICGEKCLRKYPKSKQHKFSVKMLLEGQGMKLKHNGVKLI